jgi:calcium-dependent protein kinase
MHSKNIMHRDIKPENIVLEKSNNLTTLKIVDFGLATYTSLKKYYLKLYRFKYPKCGTPGYVAPEVANLTSKD